jgi:hypothetical protein
MGRPRGCLGAVPDLGPLGMGEGGERVAQYEGYCVKCKAKRQFEGEEVTLKNGRRAAKGKCPVCGTTIMRILGKA